MTLPDITFAGHTYRDRIRRFGGETVTTLGGALSYGACAAARLGARVAVFTKMNPDDSELLGPLRDNGVSCRILPDAVTSEFEVVYPDVDPEHRQIFQLKQASPFNVTDLAAVKTDTLHLAGNAQGEFSLESVRAARASARVLALDLQAFVRQVEEGRRVVFRDVVEKRDLIAAVDILKLDLLEAEILTGEVLPERALRALSGLGCGEAVLTASGGVYGWDGQTVRFAPFANKGTLGRNGRGDTTFAAYLVRRRSRGPEASLRFASALASIKLETPGPFCGTLADVEALMSGMPEALETLG